MRDLTSVSSFVSRLRSHQRPVHLEATGHLVTPESTTTETWKANKFECAERYPQRPDLETLVSRDEADEPKEVKPEAPTYLSVTPLLSPEQSATPVEQTTKKPMLTSLSFAKTANIVRKYLYALTVRYFTGATSWHPEERVKTRPQPKPKNYLVSVYHKGLHWTDALATLVCSSPKHTYNWGSDGCL
ncbi:hypothetical protein [Leptolyngbya phage Lbo-JY12]